MTSHHNARWAVAGAVGSVALAAGLSPAAFAETGDNGAQQETVRTALEADVVLSLRDGQLALDLRPPQENAAPDADLVVGAEAATTVPAGQEYAFLGEPGSRVWILDGRRTGTPMPHWDTSDISAHELVDGSVDWALTGIDGPGDVKVFRTSQATAATETGPPTPDVLFDSADGLPDTRSLPAAQNGEVTWAFTRPGEYRLTSRATAHLATGRTTVADTEWTVRVEDTVPRRQSCPPQSPGRRPPPPPRSPRVGRRPPAC
ncbi:choice-of-anchor M domain-containing protein [Streptomyces drozdowiczii]|uniref:Choice-of-anchor M domain-containing protein n=1 Tax=Streptomyces drozdowiczii TaxID=202862 RepID=A0ABY6PLM8_9ACTN|nr:choice-of-anchor M domain-containing protein [Streptomyces drozdowiczii]UZK53107.1 choice-of-anchor M domain-containing protein [Streptomyces drozdowiczii]